MRTNTLDGISFMDPTHMSFGFDIIILSLLNKVLFVLNAFICGIIQAMSDDCTLTLETSANIKHHDFLHSIVGVLV